MMEIIVLLTTLLVILRLKNKFIKENKIVGFTFFEPIINNPCYYRAYKLMGNVENGELITPKKGIKKFEKFFLFPITATWKIIINNYNAVVFFKPHCIFLLPMIFAYLVGHKIVFDYDEWEPYTVADENEIKAKLMSLSAMISLKIGNAFSYSNTKIAKDFLSSKKYTIYLTNGVDSNKFKLMKRQDYSKIVFVGSLNKVSHLINYLKRIPKNYKLIIIGKGEQMDILFNELTKSGVNYKNKYFEDRDQLLNEIQKCGVALATFDYKKSIDYASNMKFFEYMGMGKVIIATNIGDLNKLGKTIIVNSPEEFEKLLKKGRLEQYESLGKQNAKIAKEKYDWEVLSKKFDSFLKSLN